MSAVHPFSLERPTSVDAAVAILATAPDDARVMAGGQSLTPLLTLGLSSPEIVVSLDRCADLNEIETNEAALHLGAMVTTAEVERSKHIAGIAPLLTTAAREVGSIHVRNFGTAVGNVCHADPGSDLIPALLCHHGAVQLRSPAGVRSVDIADFVTGPFSTAIAGAEIATSITISREDTDGWHHGYHKLVNVQVTWRSRHVRCDCDSSPERSNPPVSLSGAH